MTKRERVIAAIEGKKVDAIPSSFSLHFPKNQAVGDEAVAAHLKFFKETDTDIVKVMNEHLVPYYGMIRTPKDYYELIPSFSRNTNIIEDQIEMTKKIMDGVDKDAFTMGTLHGMCASGIHPLEKMGEGYNYDQVRQMQVDFLRWDEKKMLDSMERIADGMCILAERYIKDAGVDSVYYAGLGAETRWCKSGLNMKRYDEDYAALADVVNWGVYEAPMTLADGKKQFPGKTILGGLENRSGVLVDGDEYDVRREVIKVVENFGREGFILGADCTLATEQDLKLVRAAVEQARSL